MQVEPEVLRETMRNWTSGVTLVTARSGDEIHGMTVSSFTSLSLTPPLVMVSLEKNTRTHGYVSRSGVFGVTIFSWDQEEISTRFAISQTETGYRFKGLKTFSLVTGSPFPEEAMAYIDCRVVAAHEAGTHTIYYGEVVATKNGDKNEPLVYFNQGYRTIEDA